MMSDYIKREDALNALREYSVTKLKTAIRRLPSADVAPVRHGHWIHVDDVYDISGMYKGEVWECSECGYRFERLKDSGISMKVCHDCGARMDAKE